MNPTVELEDLVTLPDIGRRLGVSRQRAHQLSDMEGFPAPVGRVGTQTVWRWTEVFEWNGARSPARGPAPRPAPQT